MIKKLEQNELKIEFVQNMLRKLLEFPVNLSKENVNIVEESIEMLEDPKKSIRRIENELYEIADKMGVNDNI